ncbi:hypothetical protein ACFX2A_008845 [Malus domestica]
MKLTSSKRLEIRKRGRCDTRIYFILCGWSCLNNLVALHCSSTSCEDWIFLSDPHMVQLFLGDQTQKQMLGKHHVSAESSGFSFRKYDEIDCSLRKPLEDGGDDPELGFSPAGEVAV